MTGLELLQELFRSNHALSAEERETLQERFERLTDRQAEVLALRLGAVNGKPCTQEEAAEQMGIRVERIRQLEGAALRKLRAPTRASRAKKIAEFYQQ